MTFINKQEWDFTYKTPENKINLIEDIFSPYLKDLNFPGFDIPKNMSLYYVVSTDKKPIVNLGEEKVFRINIEYIINDMLYHKSSKGNFEISVNVKTGKSILEKNTEEYKNKKSIPENKFVISKI
jgi:hypothetical protein